MIAGRRRSGKTFQQDSRSRQAFGANVIRHLGPFPPNPKCLSSLAFAAEVLALPSLLSSLASLLMSLLGLLAKRPLVGKDLDQFSLETVERFRTDAVAAGFSIN